MGSPNPLEDTPPGGVSLVSIVVRIRIRVLCRHTRGEAPVPTRANHAAIPTNRAFQLFAFGEPIDGKTAAAMGLVSAALPAAEVRPNALAAAKALAAKPAGALQATKKLMRDAAAIQAVMAREGEVFGQRLRSPEAVEAFRAFAERRAPDFTKIQG